MFESILDRYFTIITIVITFIIIIKKSSLFNFKKSEL